MKKEFKRLGVSLDVRPVDGKPNLCRIEGSIGDAAGEYDAHRALNALIQLQSPDIGDSGYQMVQAVLRQIGFASQ
ncbi:MAG TPA: hypothetical protein VFC63_13685 [Blastocatellia bacterium]|nr:hypothetical protein [Blastocatellia bacterium]